MRHRLLKTDTRHMVRHLIAMKQNGRVALRGEYVYQAVGRGRGCHREPFMGYRWHEWCREGYSAYIGSVRPRLVLLMSRRSIYPSFLPLPPYLHALHRSTELLHIHGVSDRRVPASFSRESLFAMHRQRSTSGIKYSHPRRWLEVPAPLPPHRGRSRDCEA